MIPDGRIAELIEELDETKPHKFLDDTSISMGELRELLNTYQHSEAGREWGEGMPHRDDPPSVPVPDRWEENGWVIEHADSEVCAPLYWTGSQDEPWSADHEKALRFARERDAGVIAIHLLVDTPVRIAEHAWDAAGPDYVPAEDGEARQYVLDTLSDCADELDRALAQHSEPSGSE